MNSPLKAKMKKLSSLLILWQKLYLQLIEKKKFKKWQRRSQQWKCLIQILNKIWSVTKILIKPLVKFFRNTSDSTNNTQPQPKLDQALCNSFSKICMIFWYFIRIFLLMCKLWSISGNYWRCQILWIIWKISGLAKRMSWLVVLFLIYLHLLLMKAAKWVNLLTFWKGFLINLRIQGAKSKLF